MFIELKTLFLRSRSPTESVFNKIIQGSFQEIDLHGTEGKSLLTAARNHFTQWRYDLNRYLADEAEHFLNRYFNCASILMFHYSHIKYITGW